MKAFLIILGVLAFIGVVFIVVLPFLIGYSPGSTETTQEIKENKSVGIFRSSDGGLSWEKKIESRGSTPVNGYPILDLKFHPKNSKLIFAGTKGGGLWFSEDGADSWKKTEDKNGVLKGNSEVYKISISSKFPSDIYVAAYQEKRGRVLKSNDGGLSFSEVYFTPVEKFGVFDIHVAGDDTVYMVTGQGGFFESMDRGRTWKVLRWFKDGLIRIVADPKKPSVMYVLTPKGSIFKTSDTGSDWIDISSSLSGFSGANRNQNLFMDPETSHLYFVSSYGLLKSVNAGLKWSQVPIIIPPEAMPVLAVAVDPKNSKIIYASAANQIYKTEDGGESWSVTASPSGEKVTEIEIDPENTNIIYTVVSK